MKMVVAEYRVEKHCVGSENEYHVLYRDGLRRHIGKPAYIRSQQNRLEKMDQVMVPHDRFVAWLKEINSR